MAAHPEHFLNSKWNLYKRQLTSSKLTSFEPPQPFKNAKRLLIIMQNCGIYHEVYHDLQNGSTAPTLDTPSFSSKLMLQLWIHVWKTFVFLSFFAICFYFLCLLLKKRYQIEPLFLFFRFSFLDDLYSKIRKTQIIDEKYFDFRSYSDLRILYRISIKKYFSYSNSKKNEMAFFENFKRLIW